jgi:hypothetical protein
LASSALKPYTGFANLRVYSPELQRDFRELDVFLKDLRANVGKLLGEVQTTTVDITAVPTSTQVIAGSGLTGGGALTADITLNVGAGTGISVTTNAVGLANTAVTPASYTNTNLTVDAQGRLTAASNGSAGSGTVTHTGGALTNNLVILGAGGDDIKTLATATLGYFLRDDSTWVNIPGGGDALVANPLSQFAATTSAQLLGVISDETGSGKLMFATSPVITTDITIPNTGLHLLDTDSSHDLIIAPGSNLTADHTLTITTGDADRTLSITAAATISGTNTGDQTITLTTDVTGSGTGSFAATIANDAVTYAKMQNVSIENRLLGRATAGAGDVEEITLGTNLSYTGTTLNAAASSGANPTASVGLTVVNGVATTFLRSDGAPPLDVGIVPTWTGIHTFSAQDVHNAGVSLGTSARLSSAIADAVAAVSMNYQPGTALTSGGDRFIHAFHDSAGTRYFDIASDGSFFFGTGGLPHGANIYMGVGASAVTIDATMALGIKFGPKWGATAGVTLATIGNVAAAGQFSCTDNTTTTASTLVGGFFSNNAPAARAHTNVIGAIFMAYEGLIGASVAHGNIYGWLVKGTSTGMSSTATNSYGGYIENTLTGATPLTTNQYGLVIDEQTRGATIKNGIMLNSATAAYKAICIRDQDAYFHSSAAATMDVTATQFNVNGILKHTGASLGFFNHTTSTQPSAYTPTNGTTDRSFNADSTSIDEIADVLSTLILDLQTMGLVA